MNILLNWMTKLRFKKRTKTICNKPIHKVSNLTRTKVEHTKLTSTMNFIDRKYGWHKVELMYS